MSAVSVSALMRVLCYAVGGKLRPRGLYYAERHPVETEEVRKLEDPLSSPTSHALTFTSAQRAPVRG